MHIAEPIIIAREEQASRSSTHIMLNHTLIYILGLILYLQCIFQDNKILFFERYSL